MNDESDYGARSDDPHAPEASPEPLTSELRRLEETVARLNNEVTRMKETMRMIGIVGFLGVVVAVLSFLTARAAGYTKKVVSGNEIWLTDQWGKKRAGLYINEKGRPALRFFNEDMNIVMEVGQDDYGGHGLTAWTYEERRGVRLHSAPNRPMGLAFFGRDGNVRAELGLESDNHPKMLMIGPPNAPRLLAEVDESGKCMLYTGVTGRADRVRVGVDAEGPAGIQVTDSEGRRRVRSFYP